MILDFMVGRPLRQGYSRSETKMEVKAEPGPRNCKMKRMDNFEVNGKLLNLASRLFHNHGLKVRFLNKVSSELGPGKIQILGQGLLQTWVRISSKLG